MTADSCIPDVLIVCVYISSSHPRTSSDSPTSSFITAASSLITLSLVNHQPRKYHKKKEKIFSPRALHLSSFFLLLSIMNPFYFPRHFGRFLPRDSGVILPRASMTSTRGAGGKAAWTGVDRRGPAWTGAKNGMALIE